jgi:alkylhydroperoxidase family enzyme
MAHIRLIDEGEAEGLLREEYDAAIARAGKVFNILKSMSLNPPVLRASIELYKAIMFGESGLSRKERELLATVTSAEQFCHY